MGHFLASFATFFSGVVIAFISSWEVSLLSLLVVPLILIIGATYTKKMNAISAAKTLFLSEATTMVEQVTRYIATFPPLTRLALNVYADLIFNKLTN